MGAGRINGASNRSAGLTGHEENGWDMGVCRIMSAKSLRVLVVAFVRGVTGWTTAKCGAKENVTGLKSRRHRAVL